MSSDEVSVFVTRVLTGITFGAIFWAVYLFLSPTVFTALLGVIAAIIILFEWKNLYNPMTVSFWLFLPLYPLLPFILLMYLSHIPEYRILLLYLFILAFAHDTGAYIIGSILGTHKILPVISPKKTLEGFIGGYISALLALQIVLYERGTQKSLLFVFLFSLIACVLFLTGDMVESILKRRAGIKDSGYLLPGHGGFLDRFDGILFAVFFVFLLRTYLVTVLT